MNGLVIGIAAPLTVGLIIFITRKCRVSIVKHNQQHELLKVLPAMFDDHKVEHNDIKATLEVLINGLTKLTKSDGDQMRVTLVMLYKQFMEKESVTAFEAESFDKLCTAYFATGENGFIHQVQKEVKTLPITRS